MTTTAARYVAPVADGHEQWFIDESPKNRMVLALLSGIDEEVSWSLFRLAHLSYQHGHRFFLKPLFGLTDALMEWPLWWLANSGGTPADGTQGLLNGNGAASEIWAVSSSVQKKRKHALESLLILRNASFETANATFLMQNPRTMVLLDGLQSLPRIPLNSEFIGYLAEIFNGVAAQIVLKNNPLFPVQAISELVASTNERSLILSLLSALSTLYNNNNNSTYISPASPALDVAVRYLPLDVDRPLVAACLDYLFAHLSHPPAAKAFLLHQDMTNTLKVLVTLLVTDQPLGPRQQPLGPATLTAPQQPSVPLYQLTADELQALINTPEPQRSMDWMERMYIYAPGEDQIQGSVWLLYRDTFTPYAEKVIGGLAAAPDVIKKIMEVFPQASAVVDPGPPQRYVVRGIKRRLQEGAFKCRWDRGACNSPPFQTAEELYTHLLGHLSKESPCQWATCQYGLTGSIPIPQLQRHVLTHLPSSSEEKRDPGQPDFITLPVEPFPHPSPDPTLRSPPPPPVQNISYTVPVAAPPSTSLSALLILRILFRTSFPDSGPAPPVSDEFKFGFPMPPALGGEIQALLKAKELDSMGGGGEGERRGRRAFERVALELAKVQLADESLSGWVEEMLSTVDVSPFL